MTSEEGCAMRATTWQRQIEAFGADTGTRRGLGLRRLAIRAYRRGWIGCRTFARLLARIE